MCLFGIVALVLLSRGVVSTSEIYQHKYVPSSVCGSFDDLINNGCAYSRPSRSRLDCVGICSHYAFCSGIMVRNDTSSCVYFNMCYYIGKNINCNSTSLSGMQVQVLIRKDCQNGGVFTTEPGLVCKCSGGYVGHFCERMATHCSELLGYGYRDGVSRSLPIYYNDRVQTMRCEGTPSYYSVGLFSNTGIYDRTRNWTDYEDGYFINHKNYWLGLQNMHSLLDPDDPDTYVKGILSFTGNDGITETDTFYYYGFGVGDSSSGYPYYYSSVDFQNLQGHGNTETTLEDCLSDNQGVPFSTEDSDNDYDNFRNCARSAGAGWWFKECVTAPACNPLGLSTKTTLPTTEWSRMTLPGLNLFALPYNETSVKIEFLMVTKMP